MCGIGDLLLWQFGIWVEVEDYVVWMVEIGVFGILGVEFDVVYLYCIDQFVQVIDC